MKHQLKIRMKEEFDLYEVDGSEETAEGTTEPADGDRQGAQTGKLFFLLYVRLELCDTMTQSQKGEIMVFTIKAVGQEHILQPIRAEPMIGENSPLHKENNTTIKKKG